MSNLVYIDSTTRGIPAVLTPKYSNAFYTIIHFFLDRLPPTIKLLEYRREKVRVRSLLWHEMDVV